MNFLNNTVLKLITPSALKILSQNANNINNCTNTCNKDKCKADKNIIKDNCKIQDNKGCDNKKKDCQYVVVLDPGHAKSTAGKKSPFSLGKQTSPNLPLEEWEFNRCIVNMVKDELAKSDIDSFVTTDSKRDNDNDVSLTTRAQRGYNFVKTSGKKGIFISIHADAHGYGDQWTSANGWSVYTTKGQNISDKFADILYEEAEKVFKPKGKKIRTNSCDGDKDCESNFTVIYKTEQLSCGKIPAVLIENFFYTNIEDTRYISSEEGKKDIVKVIMSAIMRYINQ